MCGVAASPFPMLNFHATPKCTSLRTFCMKTDYHAIHSPILEEATVKTEIKTEKPEAGSKNMKPPPDKKPKLT